MKVINMQCQGKAEPIQIDNPNPFFSWQMEDVSQTHIIQTAYRIWVEETTSHRCVWDSERIESSECLQVVFAGSTLSMDTRYTWRVHIWTTSDQGNAEAEGESYFETGLLSSGWKAEWIGYDELEEGWKPFDPVAPFYCADDFDKGVNDYYLPPAPYLRKEFQIKEEIRKAKIYLSALGMLDVQINGKEITEERFLPGTCGYETIVWSKAYDVTEYLINGANAIGVVLADGLYAGYMGLHNREWYGSKPRAIIQLEIELKDGSRQYICSDKSWKASYGAFREADIFEGEYYDARLAPEGYSCAGFDDKQWKPVSVGAERNLTITAHPGVPVVEHETFTAAECITRGNGTILVDLGHFISGTLRLTLKGKAGSKIKIKHSEILDENGNLFLTGNRSARAQDTFICNGKGEEIFKPLFTYHGFRYAELQITGDVQILKVEGVSFGSLLPGRSEFRCSNKTINEVIDACVSTMECNMMDNPTDVCARDERLGWGNEGDHAVSALSYLCNQELFLRKWNEDIWQTQGSDGGVEPIAPPLMMKDVEQYKGDIQSHMGIRITYVLWKFYGDIEAVRHYYDQMQKYMDFLEQNSDRYIRFATTADWLGIWESTGHSDKDHGYGDCSQGIIGTSHYAIVVKMMEEMSASLDENEQKEHYHNTFINIQRVFYLNYIEKSGKIRFGRQGDYVMALAAGLIPEEKAETAVKELKKMLYSSGRLFWKGGTPSTPYLLPVLKKYGLTEEAGEFLSSDSYPGLGYMLKMGPGTIWERWDGILEDGKIYPNPMNAMSHLGFTSLDAYVGMGFGGLRPLEPGFKRFEFRPAPCRDVDEFYYKFKSKAGDITVHWEIRNNTFQVRLRVPANTEARVLLPGKAPAVIGSGLYNFSVEL